MSDILDYYKKYSDSGHYTLEWFKGSSRHLMIEAWLKKKCTIGDKVLDIGCGEGSYSRWMPEYNWTGIDITPAKLKYNGTFIEHDLEKSPYDLQSGSFDAVICSEVLEHLFVPEKIHAEAHRLLKPGGAYIISTPNFNWIEHTLKNYQQVIYNPVHATHTKDHIRFYTADTHINMLDKAGFQALDFQGADLQWGEFFQLARWELKQATSLGDGEVDLLLGKMFRHDCHTTGVFSVKR